MARTRRPAVTAVSLNTALDRTLELTRLTPGRVHVTARELESAGGKAVNAARVLASLGLVARVVGLAGGAAGRRARALARAEGLRATWVATAGESRVCTVLVDPEHGATVINGRGPEVAASELAALERAALARAARGDALVLAGSLPPAVPEDVYAVWTRRARAAGAPLVALDAHGPPLAAALSAAPDIVKVNREEFAALGPDVSLAAIAGRLLAGGVGLVVVTQGSEGALAFTRDGVWRAEAARVRACNATGSGDAFLAALVAGRLEGRHVPEALALATAAGALNAERLEPGVPGRPQVEALAGRVDVRAVPASYPALGGR